MSIPKFKLYHYPATRSARVKWLLHEAVGDDFEVELVPLYDGVQYEAAYLEKNPNHGVPTLEITWDDGRTTHMIESGAMIAWLADAFPEARLAPPPALSLERADYLQMLFFGASWMDMMLWQIRAHEHLLPESQRDQRCAERYRAKFTQEVEPQLKARLERSPYICGDRFSAADCVVGHNVLWAKVYGMCQDEAFSPYVSNVTKRPSFAKAFADASQFSAEVPAGKAIVGRFTG